jgi:hypothetical protein
MASRALTRAGGAEGGTATKDEAQAQGAKTVKVTVNLPESLAATLKELADQEQKTFTQALKEAISLKLFVSDLLRQRAKLLVEYKDKTVERIVFH